MDLFKRKSSAGEGGFVDVAASAEVREDQLLVVKLGGRRILLIRTDEGVRAIDAACPHAAANLAEGSLRRNRLCCHEHDYCFDIRTGRILWPEDEIYRLKLYAAEESDGRVRVRVP